MQQAPGGHSRQRSNSDDQAGFRHREGPTSKEWESVKDVVRQLYIGERRPLKYVRARLAADFNFRASDRMFKARLSQWHFTKNSTTEDWIFLFILLKSREDEGKQATEFTVHNRVKTAAEIRRHFKEKKLSDEDLSHASDVQVPRYIRCYTPEPTTPCRPPSQGSSPASGNVLYTPTCSESPPDLASPTRARGVQGLLSVGSASQSSHRPTVPNDWQVSHSPAMTMSDADLATAPTVTSGMLSSSNPTVHGQDHGEWNYEMFPEMTQTSPSHSRSSSASCDNLQQYLRSMAVRALTPDSAESMSADEETQSWMSIYSSTQTDAEMCCSKCGKSMSTHLTGLKDISYPIRPQLARFDGVPADNAVWSPRLQQDSGPLSRWLSCCLAACLCRNNPEFAAEQLSIAKHTFKTMLLDKNVLLLTGIAQLLTILHMHEQKSIAESIMNAADVVASQLLRPLDPLLISIKWLTVAAGERVERSELTSQSLREVLQTFAISLGAKHPYTLTAMYNLSYQLLEDGCFPEAQQILQELYEISKMIHGPSHIRTVTALTTLSRAQSRGGLYLAAIDTMRVAVASSKITFHNIQHPFVLECKRRLALLYQDIGQEKLMEPLYWEVLIGRINMLGYHTYTSGAEDDLIALLKRLGKWDNEGRMQKRIDDLFFDGYEGGAGSKAF